jgi:hypothetical protein
MKKQLIQFNFSGVTEKQYDQVWDELRRVGQSHPSGLIYHVASFQGSNCQVVDVWESLNAFEKFGKILTPIMRKIGIPETQPNVRTVYNEYSTVETHEMH